MDRILEGQGSFEFGEAVPNYGPEDPHSLYWAYDPENYLDDPQEGYRNIEIWAGAVQAVRDAADQAVWEKEVSEAESKKSPREIESEDIQAVLKSISRSQGLPIDLGERVELTPDLDALVAFGSAMRSKNVNPEKLVGLEDSDLANVSVYNLRYALLGRKRGPTTFNHVTFPDREFKHIFTSPTMLKKRTEARTRDAGKLRPSFDSRIAASERSSVHAYEAGAETINGLLSGIDNERRWMEELKRLLGGVRFKFVDNVTLQSLRTSALTLSFEEMIDTVAIQQKWTGNEMERAKHALDARLCYGPQHVKTRYWNQMVDLAIEYADARKATLEHNKAYARQTMA